jgi:biopolymer transport protein ExbD
MKITALISAITFVALTIGCAEKPPAARQDVTEVVLVIDDANRITIAEKEYKIDEIAKVLSDKNSKAPIALVLHTHPNSSYKKTLELIEEIKKAKIQNIVFTTEN